jgi:hypothetical protein
MAQEVDVCTRAGFQAILDQNPNIVILVTSEGCTTCPTLREAAYRLTEERGIPLLEMEFKPSQAGACEALDPELRAASDVGVAVLYKDKREVARVKATGFREFDEKHVKELLEKL